MVRSVTQAISPVRMAGPTHGRYLTLLGHFHPPLDQVTPASVASSPVPQTFVLQLPSLPTTQQQPAPARVVAQSQGHRGSPALLGPSLPSDLPICS